MINKIFIDEDTVKNFKPLDIKPIQTSKKQNLDSSLNKIPKLEKKNTLRNVSKSPIMTKSPLKFVKDPPKMKMVNSGNKNLSNKKMPIVDNKNLNDDLSLKHKPKENRFSKSKANPIKE